MTATAHRRRSAPSASKPAEALNGRVKLCWFEQGSGEPLVLIMGLGGSSKAWYRLLPLLDPGVRAIVFDNRGTGRSDGVGVRVTLDDMVADTIAVMDAAGVEEAHVFGVSMGGMVAQRLALRHRDRVRSLILGCTTAQARTGLPPWRMFAAASIRQLAPRQSLELIVPALYAQRTRREAPERIHEDLRMRRRDATSPMTIVAQMAAVGSHDVRSRLSDLDGLDVTVIHGSEDALIGVGRGRELAARIPGARLREIDDCGHLLLTDAQDAVMATLDEHLRRAGALPM